MGKGHEEKLPRIATTTSLLLFEQYTVQVQHRRIRLIEGDATLLHLKSYLQKDFAAAVCLFEAPSPPRFLFRGGNAILQVLKFWSHAEHKSPTEYGLQHDSTQERSKTQRCSVVPGFAWPSQLERTLYFYWRGRIWVRHCCCVLARFVGKEIYIYLQLISCAARLYGSRGENRTIWFYPSYPSSPYLASSY